MAEKKNDGEKLVRYISERLTAYIEMPKADRKAVRHHKAMRRESWERRWFGMLPLALAQWWKGIRNTFRKLRKLKT